MEAIDEEIFGKDLDFSSRLASVLGADSDVEETEEREKDALSKIQEVNDDVTTQLDMNNPASGAIAKHNATRVAGAIADSDAIQDAKEAGKNRGNASKETAAQHQKLHHKYKVLHEDSDF